LGSSKTIFRESDSFVVFDPNYVEEEEETEFEDSDSDSDSE
jgi:hypothetical protein